MSELEPELRSAPPHAIVPARWPSRVEARASRLFSAGRVGPLETRTRTWVPAMVPWRASDQGVVTEEVLDWYGRFADGAPGVLVVEATGIRDVPSGPLLRIGDDRFVPGLTELARLVRERSRGRTRLFIQILDFLAVRRRPEKQKFIRQFLALTPEHRARFEGLQGDLEIREALLALPHEELLALLDERERESLERGARERVTDTHLPHIANLPSVLPNLFAQAAARAKQAGFDGVELHCAHAYTLASFLSPTNTRQDGYGTTPQGRLRLPLEVIAAVRAAVGPGYVVGARFLGDEVIAGGGRIEDARRHAVAFARAGLDFLSLSKGGKFDDAKQPKVGQAVYPYTGRSGAECMPTVRIDDPRASNSRGPFGRNLPLAASVRRAVREAGFETPVVAAGGINSFDLAESALRDAVCDFVASARQSLADPDWFAKLELGLGDQVRRCKFTNYCEGLDQMHRQVTCQLWDRDFTLGDAARPSNDPPKRSSDGRRRLLAPPAVPGIPPPS
ncbi:MAG TPA: NADH:flavin oxidoreductase [Planctomycetota bacterium]|nr:NADH:flavin oxidoreductase [Planctomycetota bacterium]